MSQHRTNRVIEHLRRAGILEQGSLLSDAELLELYRTEGKTDAFTLLVERHGPMVWNVCSRMLKHRADIEDAFQATFLVLVRKARSLKSPELLGNWLYGVAVSVAGRVRFKVYRNQKRESSIGYLDQLASTASPTSDSVTEVLPYLDQALSSLPEKYRLPILLCDLQGLARREVAQQLAIPEGTVASRHARGREMLAKKLRKRGVTFGTLALLLERGISSAKLPNTVISSALQMIGQTSDALKTLRINELSNGVIQQMGFQKFKLFAFASVALVCVAVGAFSLNGSPEIVGQATPDPITPKSDPPKKDDLPKVPPKREEPKNKLDADVLKAWVAAGSISGWMGSLPNGLVEFRHYPDGLTNPIPAFQFQAGSKFAFDKLPAPKSAFGLDFTNLLVLDRHLSQLLPFENLQYLELNNTAFSTEFVKQVSKFPNLEYLGLRKKNLRVTDSEALAKLHKIRVLDLRDTPLQAKEFALFKDLKTLQVLSFGGGKNLDEKVWVELKGCQNLTHLVAWKSPFGPSIWKEIAELNKLQFLDMDGVLNNRINDHRVSIQQLKKLPELHSLVLREMELYHTETRYLKDCSKLKYLEYDLRPEQIRNLYLGGKPGNDRIPMGLKDLDQVQTLESLRVNPLDGGIINFETIRKIPNLKILDLRGYNSIPEYYYPQLNKQLKKIILTPETYELKLLTRLDNLEVIEITINYFYPKIADELAQIKNLTRIEMGSVKAHKMKDVAKLTQVREMVLSSRGESGGSKDDIDKDGNFIKHPPINDESLKELVNLKNLRILELFETDVTEKGLEELRKALPDCIIVKH